MGLFEISSGFFGMVLENVYQNSSEKMLSTFNRLGSDMHRVAFVSNMKHYQNETNDMVKENYKGKFSKLAEEARVKGNKFFGKREYDSALRKYTDSVLFAPVEENNNQLALALANRSAALYHLGRLKECLTDCEAAFKHGYPGDMHYKLHDRMGKCYTRLENREQSTNCFKRAKSTLNDAHLDNKKHQTWTEDIERQLKKCDHMPLDTPKDKNDTADSTSELTYGKNPRYSRASSAVDIRYTPGRGRFAVANRDIEIGDTLIAELPFASVMLPDFLATHCYCCYKRIKLAYPCRQCSGVRYCSEECSEKSWNSGHKFECKFTDLIIDSGVIVPGLLPLRLVTCMGLKKLLAFRDTLSEQGEDSGVNAGCNKDGDYLNNYWAVYNMVTNTELREPKELIQLSMVAVFMLQILQKSGFFVQDGISCAGEDIAYVGGLILRHMQQALCNAHEICEMLLEDDFRHSKFLTLGIGMYVTSSLLNHSCNPSVDRNFVGGDRAVCRAITNIKKGEEITDEYGALFFLQTKEQRQAVLRPQYFFDCKCEACVNNWPLHEDLLNKLPVVRCEMCGSALQVQNKEGLEKTECPKCCHVTNAQEKLDLLMESHTKYIEAMKSAINGDTDGALPTFEKHLSLLCDTLCQPWSDYNNCQAALKQAYRISGNCIRKRDL
ncbi:unnamed protein product [Owenia fusiformis]|uniref:Protein-lysine N-methyltransferase SMYD4 n=1 Tax=Owenia fusiformis TaxID=6347 RepID=A0A8J1TVP7_OWEFU|nr:unnamed protein product [Owenia fusiformis]